MKLKAPKGTRDILPAEISRWQYIEDSFRKICNIFGYSEIRIPTFESTGVFERGVGDTTDIVQKEMYTFEDKGKRSITLRPEGTAGVARAYIENGMGSLPSPVRLFYNITAFRYENVQKGRYREFHQLGLEAFGSNGPHIDAEIIGLLDIFFKNLQIMDAKVKINSIGCPECRKIYNEKLREYLEKDLSSLCELCKGRFEKNPLRIIDCKNPSCQEVTKSAPSLLDNICDDCRIHFEGLEEELGNMNISYEVDKNIVRGLDYYTKTVFEFVSENVGTQGTICGGGRYDGLIAEFGGAPTPGIGFALGLERLILEADAQGIKFDIPAKERIYIAFADKVGENVARKTCMLLRKTGIVADTDLCSRSFRAQIKYAGKNGFDYMCVIGSLEAQKQEFKVKNMNTGEEETLLFSEIEKLRYDDRGGIIWPNR